jgi:hypothetical protein
MFGIRKLFIRLAHKILKFAIEARSGQTADTFVNDAEPVTVSAPPAKQSPLRPLGAGVAHENTIWIPRILWALEWAHRNGEEPASAAALARILTEEAGTKVAATNTARAFRDLKKDGRGAGLWSGDKEYRITPEGRQVLQKLLG